MPHENRDQDRDEDDDNDTYGSRAAPTTVVNYNRAISHTSHCSFRVSQSADVIPRVQASISGGGEAGGMWAWSGFVLSLGLALVAWARSRASSRTYYEGEVYGMDRSAHRKYALGFAALAAAFLGCAAWPRLAENPFGWVPAGLLAIAVLLGILYLATFVRGAAGEDE